MVISVSFEAPASQKSVAHLTLFLSEVRLDVHHGMRPLRKDSATNPARVPARGFIRFGTGAAR